MQSIWHESRLGGGYSMTMGGCQRPEQRPEQRPKRGSGSGALAATGLRARLWRRGLAVLALAVVPLLSAAPEVRAELLIGNLNIGTATNSSTTIKAIDGL